MSAPRKIIVNGAIYVRADQPVMPSTKGPLGVGPHMPHQSPQPQPMARPPGGGQSAGGPGGPARPIQGPAPYEPPVPQQQIRKQLRRFLGKLRQVSELAVDLRDLNLRQLLADYHLPALHILLSEWSAARERLVHRLDDAEMELTSTGRTPETEPSLAPSIRLKQKPWPTPSNPFTGPQNR